MTERLVLFYSLRPLVSYDSNYFSAEGCNIRYFLRLSTTKNGDFTLCLEITHKPSSKYLPESPLFVIKVV